MNRMNRRTFMTGLAGCGVCSAFGKMAPLDYSPEVTKDRIDLGLGKSFRMLHLSDSHLSLFYEAEAKGIPEEFRVRQSKWWFYSKSTMAAQIAYAKDNGLPILHTGDLLDYTSEAAIDAAKDFFSSVDVFACIGNHDFNNSGPDRKATEARFATFWPNDIPVASRVVNGVNFVAFDNGDYSLSAAIMERIRTECRKNLPVVLMCHVPFYEPSLQKVSLEHHKWAKASFLIGVPREIVATYPNPVWRDSQMTSEETLDYIEELRREPNIRAVLVGHIHFPYKSRFSPTAMQYVCGCSAYQHGQLREITFC